MRGRPALDGAPASAAEAALVADLATIRPLDADAMAACAAHLDRLTKPPGSLGRLETLAIQLAGISGRPDGTVAARAIVVAAADHGVARRGVSAYPPEVTAQMVANFVAGGAAINVLAATIGARVVVVDAGVAGPIPDVTPDPDRGGRLVTARVRPGTADMTDGPAMTRDEALSAIATGRRIVTELSGDATGLDLLGVGEMGIGNTTAASALAAVLTGASVEAVTGRGTGIDDAGRQRKIAAIETAIAVNDPDPADPLGVLAAVGGLEIAVLVGVLVEAALAGIPVVLDGFISTSAALVAVTLERQLGPRLIAGHRSTEPGHRIVLDHLGLTPILELDLRLGEASGAALAMGVIVAAAAIRDEMATFEFGRDRRAGMTTVVLVRHASTDLSGRRYSGRGDPPLSPAGRREAEALAQRLETMVPPGVRIVTSPSRRAHDTAAILAARLAPAVIDVDERWLETDVGDAEGLTFDEVAERYPDLGAKLAAGDADIDWPGGETALALSERVAAALASVRAGEGTTIIVSHAGTLRIAQALATGRPSAEVPFPGTAEAVFLDVDHDRPMERRDTAAPTKG